LFHARPVDRGLDRPRQVVHGERAGRTPLGFRLDGHGWSRPRPMGIPGYLRVLRRHFPLILTRRAETREGGFGGRQRKKVNPLRLYIALQDRAAGRRGVCVTVEERRDSILRPMPHLGLGKEDDFLVDIAKLRIEREGVEEIRDWLRVLKDFLVRRNQREKIDL